MTAKEIIKLAAGGGSGLRIQRGFSNMTAPKPARAPSYNAPDQGREYALSRTKALKSPVTSQGYESAPGKTGGSGHTFVPPGRKRIDFPGFRTGNKKVWRAGK